MDALPVDKNALPNLWGITQADIRANTATPTTIEDINGKVWHFLSPGVSAEWKLSYKTPLEKSDGFAMGYRNSHEIITWLFDLHARANGQNFSEKEREALEAELRTFLRKGIKNIKIEEVLVFLERLETRYHIQGSHDLALRILGFSQMDIGAYLTANEWRILREWVRIETFLRSLSGNKDIIEILRSLYENQWSNILWWLPSGILSSVSSLGEGSPREQRLMTQDMLAKFVDIVREKTGVSIAAISFWGKEHGDGGAIFRIPNKWEKWDTFLIFSKVGMSAAWSIEDALDSYTRLIKRPVFTHYSGEAHGNIKTQVETPISRWMRDQIFSDEKIMKEWLKNIPVGIGIWISFSNTGGKVTITSMTTEGWFMRGSMSQEDFYGILTSTGSVTFGKEWENILLYATGSDMSFADPGYKRQQALQLWAQAKAMILNKWDVTVEWHVWWVLSAQTNAWEYKNIQTAEWKFWAGLTGKYKLSEKTQFWLSIEWDGLWAPNATPNYFYKLPLNERNISNFLKSMKVSANVKQILKWGDIVIVEALREQSSFQQKSGVNLKYENGINYAFMRGEKNTGTDDFSPTNNNVIALWIWGRSRGIGWRVEWSETRYPGKNHRTVGAYIVIPLGK